MRLFKQQRGAELVEYAIATLILVAVFAMFSVLLVQQSEEHMNRTEDVLDGFTPCSAGGKLTNTECF